MVEEYIFTVTIRIEGNETKKNTIRNNIASQLEAARTAGIIIEAEWNISTRPVTETGALSPL